MAAALHEALQSVLFQRAGLEVVQGETRGEQQVRFFGRVKSSQMPTWLSAVQGLLQAAELESGRAWTIDISKQYFLRSGKLFFGWRVIIQGSNLTVALPRVIEVVQRVQPVLPRVDEIPLHARPDRNALRNGRGAQPADKAIVGPMAKTMLGMG